MKHTHFRKLLASQGLTPADVARLGFSYGTVLSHYYGSRRMSLKTAKRYGDILKISFWELLEEPAPANIHSPAANKQT